MTRGGVQDGIKRWMTPEGTFRILTASATGAVREAVRFAGSAPEVSELYGRLLIGTALLQLAQSPFDRVQARIVHSGTMGDLHVDVWPGPVVRGRVMNPAPESGPVMGTDGLVHFSRRPLRGGQLYESVAPLQGGSVAAALQQYCLESEQVLTLFSLVTVLTDEGGIEAAAGMIVQALPGMTHEHLASITKCLETASFAELVRAGDDPISATEAIFHPLSLHHVGGDPIEYRCRCSKQAAVQAVLLLAEEELEEVRAGGEERVTCEYCQTTWAVTADDLPPRSADRS